ncbi:acid phosphatase [Xylona heveae TC161]|uniref:Acid phosphatase n=1 Tax=Xylona heveae (strain CBS 132557 / TC161) TaxID=1328760 RepID=A0A165AIE4_XYLHT|nr:acid phosphatase [Xylona heveae TC161]KZF20529.1 acid phosphatase [Xylona heveae TC161]
MPLAQAAETVLGVYVFHRHGDRTAKMTPPANLTDLGYFEVFTSGQWFRNRYIASDASAQVHGMSTDIVKQSQITVSAPSDTVLFNSAQGFLQGLYPPVGSTMGAETLRNGTKIESPLNGYQLIPIQALSTGTNSENAGWLQGASGCNKAASSSNQYFFSNEYNALFNSTTDFYKGLTPMINNTFPPSQISYKNAYTIFDLLNVASIHNASFPSSNLLTNETFFQLRTLADTHEWNLAYNESEPVRAMAGASLAAQVVQQLNTTITGMGKSKFAIQFGAYANFMSFFGLAQLTKSNPDFYGVPDYASSMTFELVTNASTATFPAADDISVRFLFHNGTTSNSSEPIAYPLFGQSDLVLPWTTFVDEMNKFAVGSEADWCKACGNTDGACAAYTTSNSTAGTSSSSSSGSSHHGGMSLGVAGVIGAMVTLGVILGLELLIVLVGGLRLVSKKRLANTGAAAPAVAETKA